MFLLPHGRYLSSAENVLKLIKNMQAAVCFIYGGLFQKENEVCLLLIRVITGES